MNIIKINIFSNLDNKKTIFLNNVKEYFGSRIIDTLVHFPLGINRNNLRTDFNVNDINKIITLDVKIIKHFQNYNKKSPYKVVGQIESKQEIMAIEKRLEKHKGKINKLATKLLPKVKKAEAERFKQMIHKKGQIDPTQKAG